MKFPKNQFEFHRMFNEEGACLAHTNIDLERRRELWPVIFALPSEELSYDVYSYLAHKPGCERSYGKLTTDSYGAKVRFAKAGDLAKLKDHECVVDNVANRAAWAYLSALDPEDRVGLYWH